MSGLRFCVRFEYPAAKKDGSVLLRPWEQLSQSCIAIAGGDVWFL
jgi:hypothetical protein